MHWGSEQAPVATGGRSGMRARRLAEWGWCVVRAEHAGCTGLWELEESCGRAVIDPEI